mmetsp:Transcript_35453/g.64956  ORF Transcript_35453/g.64956 Transcript_35453/m.64956 type:complete len:364 (+) Transcript_35453:1033-2124(+)
MAQRGQRYCEKALEEGASYRADHEQNRKARQRILEAARRRLGGGEEEIGSTEEANGTGSTKFVDLRGVHEITFLECVGWVHEAVETGAIPRRAVQASKRAGGKSPAAENAGNIPKLGIGRYAASGFFLEGVERAGGEDPRSQEEARSGHVTRHAHDLRTGTGIGWPDVQSLAGRATERPHRTNEGTTRARCRVTQACDYDARQKPQRIIGDPQDGDHPGLAGRGQGRQKVPKGKGGCHGEGTTSHRPRREDVDPGVLRLLGADRTPSQPQLQAGPEARGRIAEPALLEVLLDILGCPQFYVVGRRARAQRKRLCCCAAMMAGSRTKQNASCVAAAKRACGSSPSGSFVVSFSQLSLLHLHRLS